MQDVQIKLICVNVQLTEPIETDENCKWSEFTL